MPDVAAVVSSLILARTLCVRCIAVKASATDADVEDALESIGVLLDLRRHQRARCESCGQIRHAFSLDAPAR